MPRPLEPMCNAQPQRALSLHLTNTLSGKKELFVPLDKNSIKMYVCGPTVYDRAHIGNARCYVVFDLLFRVLKFLYPEVVYVRNLTDIDDKIILRAQERGVCIAELTEETTAFFHEDLEALGNLAPTFEPKATAHISQMITMIDGLVSQNHAYVQGDHVFFSIRSDPHYGALSHHEQDALKIGARIDVDKDKRDPGDFVLWKPSLSHEIGWDSPWGRGRPGWHIECSAMSAHLLGPTFDIHGGGQDLIFPHHENELAQSQCFHKAPFVSYWVHNGYLRVNGEKMSKSLGNFLTPYDLLKNHSGEAIRYALLSSHYRQPLNWTSATVSAAEKSLHSLYRALQSGLGDALTPKDLTSRNQKEPPQAFVEALLDDLNTPKALAVLHKWAKKILCLAPSDEKTSLAQELLAGGLLLGLFQRGPYEKIQGSSQPPLLPAEIDALMAKRAQARQKKDFKEADDIRQYLLEKGILLEDSPQGTTWRVISSLTSPSIP